MTVDDEAETNRRHAEAMKALKAERAALMAEKTDRAGLLLVHTGDGKGKSTAAFGMIARALGWGQRVGVVQFIKGPWLTGEGQFFARFPDQVRFETMGEGFTWDTQDRARDIAVAREAWEACKARILDPDWDMVVCDELNIVLRYDYLPLDEVLEVLRAKPEGKHVVVTGRNAPAALIELADLATEMTMLKHPFRSGVKAQAGVEF